MEEPTAPKAPLATTRAEQMALCEQLHQDLRRGVDRTALSVSSLEEIDSCDSIWGWVSLLFWYYSGGCKVLCQLIPVHFLGSCAIYFSNITQAGRYVELCQHCQVESVQGDGQKTFSWLPNPNRTPDNNDWPEFHLHLWVSPTSTPKGPKDGIPIKLRKESQHRLPEGIITKGE